MAKEKDDRPLLQVRILRTKTQKFRGICITHGTDMTRAIEAFIDSVIAGKPLPPESLKPKSK